MDRLNNKCTLITNVFLYLLPILGVIGVTVPLIIDQTNLSIIGIYLAIPMILGPIIYIKQHKNEDILTIWNHRLFTLCIIFYFICVSISLYLLYIFDVRPVTYYLTIAIMSGLILLEIIQFNISKKELIVILIQLMILIEDIIWGVNLKYNFYIARTDPMGHVWLIQNLINNSHITEVFNIYKPFPLWHILCTFIYRIAELQLSTQKIMFFTNGLIYSFIPVMIYLTSMKIFKDYKVSLLSALFVSVYPMIISYGMSSIARSVVSFLEIMLVLLLLYSESPEKRFIAIVLSFSLIVYHTASVQFVIFLLLMIYILNIFINNGKEKPLLLSNFILLLTVMTLSYWIHHASTLIETLAHAVVMPAHKGIETKSVIYTPLTELFNYLQYSPLLFFIIVGFLGALQSKKMPILGKIFCIIGLFTVSVSIPGPAMLFNKFVNNLQIDRFGEYAFLFIGLTSAIGFYDMYKKSRKYSKILLIILFISTTFLSVSNEFTAADNPLVKRPFYTPYLTSNEETAFRHIAFITQGYVMSDYVTMRYLKFSQYENKTHIQEIYTGNMTFLKNQTDDVFLIRTSELAKRPLKYYSSPSNKFTFRPAGETRIDYYYQDTKLWKDLTNYNKIYNSGSSEAFN